MQRQLEATDRPWIMVELTTDGPFRFDEEGRAILSVRVTLTNVGNSPAVGVEVGGQMFPFSMKVADPHLNNPFDEVMRRQEIECENARRSNVRNPRKWGFTLFKEQEEHTYIGATMSKEDLERGAFTPPTLPPGAPGTKLIGPVIVGCVDYQLSFGSEHHQTGFIYDVSRIGPPDTRAPLMFWIGVDVPVENVRLERYYFSGGYAN